MAKFFLVVEPSCLKKRVLKPKCVSQMLIEII